MSYALIALLGLAVVFALDFGYFGSRSGDLCKIFIRKPQPGLFSPFYGRVCSKNPKVKAIAINFGECVDSGTSLSTCSSQEMGYFRASGADAEDAQKALALVVRAYHNA